MNQRREMSDGELEQTLKRSAGLDDAPEHVIQRAIALSFARRTAPQQPSLWRRLQASVTFDSGTASPLAFGQRSTGGSVRQLLYSVEGIDIDLRVMPVDGADSYVLSGQVLGPDAVGVIVVETLDGIRLNSAALSDMGEFSLPALASGDYRLRLETGQADIQLPPVQLPHAALG